MRLLLAMLLAQVEPSAAATPPPRISVSALKSDCVTGIGGEDGAMGRCTDAMLEYAKPFQEAPPEQSSCLGSDHGTSADLVWNWLSWLDDHEVPDEADAGSSVSASILDRWPCGWSEG